MAKGPATMKDVAEACGVSLSTVSLVLSDNPRISEETRSKVKAAVERFGYQPDTHARGLALQTSRTLAVVVPEINHVFADIYFGEIISGVYDRAADHRYKILLDLSNDRFIRTREYLNVLRTRRADGMLFIASSLYDQFLRDFEKERYPFLLVNHYLPDSTLDFIAADYKDTGRQAARHLLGLGHRRIGLISGTNVQTAIDFRSQFEAECHEAGLGPDALPWADGDFREEGGFKATETLLEQHPEITAVMAGNDKMAIGAMRYLLSRGLRVPGDLSVMGVDDIPSARFTTPGLTTIRHDLYELGRLACDRLLTLFKGEAETCREVRPVTLVERESTGPAHPRTG
jgi:DNA-binding LacI/PurR family transcriptional regulator